MVLELESYEWSHVDVSLDASSSDNPVTVPRFLYHFHSSTNIYLCA